MMKSLPPIMKALILSGMFFLLLGATKDTTIQITPSQPAFPVSRFATGTKIKVYNFIDNRQGKLDPYLIGNVTGYKLKENYYSDRPVFMIVTEAVKSGLIRKGYKIVQENEDFSVKGNIVQFWTKTFEKFRVTSAWDVETEVTLTMEVSRSGQKVGSTLGSYIGRKVDRQIVPDTQMVKWVLEGALMDAIQAMSSDPNLTYELSKKKN